MQSPVLLLACDLDGTLIPTLPTPVPGDRFPGDGAGVTHADERFAPAGDRFAPAGERFHAFARERVRWDLAYVTGRHRSLAEEGIRDHGLPDPDWLLCDVGTSLYRWEQGGSILDPTYRSLMGRMADPGHADRIRAALSTVDGLELQDESRQAEFKVSFTAHPGVDGAALRSAVREAVGDGIAQIWSEDPVTGRGLLDLLPRGVSKAHAVDHLRRELGLPLARVAFAGDSGNDRDALLMGCLGILVGNAPDTLRRELEAEARERDLLDRVYFATSHFADGVLEGLDHFALP